MIMLLEFTGDATVSWLIRQIPTSPNTVVQCARILEEAELVFSRKEQTSLKRRLYSLTPKGKGVADTSPENWVGDIISSRAARGVGPTR